MKQSILILFIVSTFVTLSLSQVKTPAPSPMVKIEQDFGLSSVTLEYSRPGVKEREIFGDLVPYDKMWRTGANKNSLITFSDAVTFGESNVEAGTYALFTKPGTQMWDIYLYTDTENWGTPKEWSEDNVAAHTSVKATMLANPIESMHIGLENISSSTADLVLSWANTSVAIPLVTKTDEMAMATIDNVMAGPSASDYYNAARYYRENGKDLDQALSWMEAAIEKRGELFWNTRQLALIQADLGDYKGAIETAKRSLDLAKESKNDNYVKFNEESIKEWKKMKK